MPTCSGVVVENKVGEKRARSPSLEGADDHDVQEGGVPDPNHAAENVNPEVHQELQAADRLPPVNPNAHMLMLSNIAANANQIEALLQTWVGQQHPGAPRNSQILNQMATNGTPEVRAVIQASILPGVVQHHQHHPEEEEAIGHDHDQVATAGQEVAPPPPPLNPLILNQIAAANANPEVRAAIQALMVPGAVLGPLPPLQDHDHQADKEAVGHEHEALQGKRLQIINNMRFTMTNFALVLVISGKVLQIITNMGLTEEMLLGPIMILSKKNKAAAVIGEAQPQSTLEMRKVISDF